MDREPINESHDGESPQPSGRPAGAMNATPNQGDAAHPPAATVSIPCRDGVADRPAGPGLAPPPPPPGRAAVVQSRSEWGSPRSVFGEAPPTGERPAPPFSATPPRPADSVPPSGATGRPPLAPPSPPAVEAPPPPRRRSWRVAASVVAVFALLGGGFAAGNFVSNSGNTTATAANQPVVMPAAGTTAAPTPTLPDVAGPLAGSGSSDEPVADVARVVAPSVVLVKTDLGQGSGIVWNAEKGYIVTNNHVAAGSQTVQVTFADGAVVTGRVIGGDSRRDVAVIKVDPTGLNMVQAVFAPAHTVEVGQLAVAIGSPFGLDQTVTAGIVSAIDRINNAGSDVNNQGPVRMIQTDAPINPGNSGGALADREGRVIGMNTSIRTDGRTDGNIGVGFALPSETVDLIARRIVSGESPQLGFLGIKGETPTDGSQGASVVDVVAGSPAAKAGLKVGDLIVSAGGETINSMSDLAAQIQLYRPGDSATLVVRRDGNPVTLNVVLGTK